jgi:hypothetical protein
MQQCLQHTVTSRRELHWVAYYIIQGTCTVQLQVSGLLKRNRGFYGENAEVKVQTSINSKPFKGLFVVGLLSNAFLTRMNQNIEIIHLDARVSIVVRAI